MRQRDSPGSREQRDRAPSYRIAMRKRSNPDTNVVSIPDRMAKAQTITPSSTELRDEFKEAHARGMSALERHDYDALDRAISDEAQIIEAHSALLTTHQKQAAALSRKISANTKKSTKAKRAVARRAL